MKNKKICRTLAALCTCLVLMGGFSVTAFAQGTDPAPAATPAADATNDSNVVVEETEDSPALTPRRAASAAADFAAKEAFLKAAGTGLAGPFALAEIEAVRLDSGAPAYRFSGRTAEWVARRHLTAHLTLSHDGGMAMAFCLLEAAPDAS